MNSKKHYFKEWKRLQTQHSRNHFINSHNTCSKAIKNAKSSYVQRINDKIASCQAGSRSFLFMAKVVSQSFCQSSFPKQLWFSFYHSIIQGQSFCVSLCLQLQTERPRVPTTPLPPFKIHYVVNSNSLNSIFIKFSTRKVRQTLLQLDTSKSKGPVDIPAIVLKPVLLNLRQFLTNYFSFPALFAHFPPHGNKPTSFLSQKKAISLIHSTIVPLQSLQSSLKQWRPSSLNNFLPSLKQTIFSLITSMAFQSQVYWWSSCLCCPCLVLCSRILWLEQSDLSRYLQGRSSRLAQGSSR